MKSLPSLLLAVFFSTSLHAQIPGSSPGKRIAVTFDDIPIAANTPIEFSEVAAVNSRLLAALKKFEVRAVGFVNEDRLLRPGHLDAGVALMESWLDAGMELGNHNFGHLGLWKSSLSEVEDAVLKGEVLTRWLTSRRSLPLRYYRHPFTQTGKDEAEKLAFEAFLSARGYRVAPFTIEHDDFVYSCVYDRLGGPEGDKNRQILVAEYNQQLRQAVAVYESMSDQLFGRQIPQILLLHATRLNAETLGTTLATLKELGYTFVTLEEALGDEAYRSEERASRQYGPSWLSRWARARGTRLSVYGHPDPTGSTSLWAAELCP